MTAPGPAILVTGAAGYVGRLTTAALAARRGELGALVGTDVRPAPPELAGVRWIARDIAEPGLAAILTEHRIDTVIHLASIVQPPRGQDAEQLAHRVDVIGTERLLAACVETGVRKVVVTTSGAAYGYWPDNPEWITEEHEVRGDPRFAYARNKRLVEELLARHREEHPGLAQLVFRPGTILGERTENQITDLFDKPVILGIAGTRVPFVFVWDRDVVQCLVDGALGEHTGTYNLAGDGVVTMREIAARLGKPYLPLPAGGVKVALAVLRRLGLTQYGPEQVGFLQHRPVLSNRKLVEELGCRPRSSRDTFELFARAREARGKAHVS